MTINDEQFVERLNREKVAPSDMGALLEEMDLVPRSRSSYEAGVIAMLKVLPDRSPDYRMALMLRLGAMHRFLTERPDIRGLMKPETDGGIFIADWTMVAACECEMLPDGNGHVRFDDIVFKRAAMKATEPEGRADTKCNGSAEVG